MISLSKHAFRFFFSCVMGLVLVACGGSSTIGNGQNLTNLSGKAGSLKKFSIKLPINATGLMIQAAGSDDISLDLQDSAGNSLGVCTQPLFCVWQTPVEGTYTLQLQAAADYSGVNLSASWGGPDVSVLKNNIALTGLKGDASTVLLKSLFLPENVPLLKVAASGSTSVQLELVDSLGNPVWHCGSHSCLLPALQANLYYVRATATAAYSDVSLKANWGASFGATMENGDTIRYSNVKAHTQINESFYWPEGVEAVALATSAPGAGIALVSASGEYAPMQCAENGGRICVASDLPGGLYHFSAMIDMEDTDLSLTLRFGGRNHSTVASGQSTAPVTSVSGEQVVESFYIEPGTAAAAVGVSIFTRVKVYDVNGNTVLCDYQPCHLNNPQHGTYFVSTFIDDATYTPRVSVSLATGSPDATTLISGQTKRGSFDYTSQEKVESFYVGPNIDAFAVSISGEHAHAYITDAAGTPIVGCSPTESCVAEATTPGIYFAHLTYHDFGGTADQYQIALALGGQDASTLQSGQTSAFQSVQTGDVFLDSFYVSPGMDSAALASSMNTRTIIYNAVGSDIDCAYYCTMNNLQPGVYFADTRVVETEFSSSASVSLALGGENGATIANGQTKRGIFEFSFQEKVESFYVSSEVTAAAIAVTGENASALILDSLGNPLTDCNASRPCVFTPASAGTYFIHQHFHNPGQSNVSYSISLALGGEGVATVESGKPSATRSVVAEETFIESFQISEGMTSFSFITGMESSGAIYNTDGQTVCAGLPCILSNLVPGSYFATIRPFEGGLATNINASFAAGGPNHSTLANGQTKKSTINHAFEQRVESFYAGPGVDSFILANSNENIGFYVVDENFQPIKDCWANAPCIGQIATPGVYFVYLSFHDTALVGQEYSISLALGGEQAATLKWNEIAPVYDVRSGTVLVQSIYRDSASAVTAVTSSENTMSTLYDSSGNVLCHGNYCVLKDAPVGSYFLVSTVFDHFWLSQTSFAVAETGPDKSDLQNGEVHFIEGAQYQRVVRSLKLEEDENAYPTIESLMIRNSDTYVELTVFNDQGEVIATCLHLAPCVIGWPGREHLFVLVEIFHIPEDIPASISAAWVGPGTATMDNGTLYSLSTPTPVFNSVQSFNLDTDAAVQLFMNTHAVDASITDINGQIVQYCPGAPCPSLNLPAGRYFLLMSTTPTINYVGDTFQYSLSW